MSRRNTSTKPNGHARSHGRPNGHAPGSATAPGTDCKAYAEAAPPTSEKKNGKMEKKNQQNGKQKGQKDAALKKFLLAGPTDFAAMQDGAAYVNSVASRVDLVGVSVWLV